MPSGTELNPIELNYAYIVPCCTRLWCSSDRRLFALTVSYTQIYETEQAYIWTGSMKLGVLFSRKDISIFIHLFIHPSMEM